jgi:uncharacterized OsmC-like protein
VVTTDDRTSTEIDDPLMTAGIRHVLGDSRVLFDQHPELAQSGTIVRAELGDATLVRIQAGGHAFLADEPRAAGGGGAAPSSIEYALAALASCTAVTYRYWSELLDIPIDLVKVDVRCQADRRGLLGFDADVAPGPSSVQVRVALSGSASEDEYARLHDAVEAHSPVLAMISTATAVTTTLVSRTRPGSTSLR